MEKIAIIGAGYVGLVTGVGLADFGNYVTCADNDPSKIDSLKNGIIPIYEPGLEEYLKRNLAANRITFTTNVENLIRDNDIIFIAVGTPSDNDGSADLSAVIEVSHEISRNITGYKTIIVKSTVPVGTNKAIRELIIKESGLKDFDVVSNPEFLREGKAIQDFSKPDRVVVGVTSNKAKEIVKKLYRPLNIREVPFVFCTPEEAELVKYASNAFLAMKITFANEVANLCEAFNADIHIVTKAVGMDERIGPKFLHPGPGYGGSCFPKDTRAFVKIGEKHGIKMLLTEQVIMCNEAQKLRMVEKLKRLMNVDTLSGKTIGVFGLAFKAETDDVRESPAIRIIEKLLEEKAIVKVHDPKAMNSMKKIFPENMITYCASEYDAATNADAIMILTEWNQYRGIDITRIKNLMREKIILDCRNILDPVMVKSIGFTYEGVGRK